ncbi:unnamed protein product [Protopolystoma xenopodis]|uniref:GS catalytic domain-containing protein n=1 Tax=Protopolystoma xenopodis TaxID=117903 RepID=A0A3S5CVD5_9PLAT|nr:unnamed protein product [Protopolystoma xenopodis]
MCYGSSPAGAADESSSGEAEAAVHSCLIINIPDIVRVKHYNGCLRADLSTLKPVPWASKMCPTVLSGARSHCPTGELSSCPPGLSSAAAANTVARLAVCPARPASTSQTPVAFTDGEDMYKTSIHALYEKFFFRIDAYLQAVGIEVQDYSIENGDAQLEMPLMPRYGLEAADMYFEFKQAVREIGSECGMAVSFMTRPLAGRTSSGCHYNHSLWDVTTGENAFYDETSESGTSSRRQRGG